MNLVKLQDTKLMHRNLLHAYILTTKEQELKLMKQFHLLSVFMTWQVAPFPQSESLEREKILKTEATQFSRTQSQR